MVKNILKFTTGRDNRPVSKDLGRKIILPVRGFAPVLDKCYLCEMEEKEKFFLASPVLSFKNIIFEGDLMGEIVDEKTIYINDRRTGLKINVSARVQMRILPEHESYDEFIVERELSFNNIKKLEVVSRRPSFRRWFNKALRDFHSEAMAASLWDFQQEMLAFLKKKGFDVALNPREYYFPYEFDAELRMAMGNQTHHLIGAICAEMVANGYDIPDVGCGEDFFYTVNNTTGHYVPASMYSSVEDFLFSGPWNKVLATFHQVARDIAGKLAEKELEATILAATDVEVWPNLYYEAIVGHSNMYGSWERDNTTSYTKEWRYDEATFHASIISLDFVALWPLNTSDAFYREDAQKILNIFMEDEEQFFENYKTVQIPGMDNMHETFRAIVKKDIFCSQNVTKISRTESEEFLFQVQCYIMRKSVKTCATCPNLNKNMCKYHEIIIKNPNIQPICQHREEVYKREQERNNRSDWRDEYFDDN